MIINCYLILLLCVCVCAGGGTQGLLVLSVSLFPEHHPHPDHWPFRSVTEAQHSPQVFSKEEDGLTSKRPHPRQCADGGLCGL